MLAEEWGKEMERKNVGIVRTDSITPWAATPLQDPSVQFVLAGNTMKSMPRMRKSWITTPDIPKELLSRHGSSKSMGKTSRTGSPPPPLSNLSLLEEMCAELQVDQRFVDDVSPGRMQKLEDDFTRGMIDAGGAGAYDLSFLNQVNSKLADGDESIQKEQQNINVPTLNFSKTATTRRKISDSNPDLDQRHFERKEELQPYLGPRLKKNLRKIGLEKQLIPLTPDEWDDEDTINMMGSMFASKEAERIARHMAWYQKKMDTGFVKKFLSEQETMFASRRFDVQKRHRFL
jgi:hypothetical protein